MKRLLALLALLCCAHPMLASASERVSDVLRDQRAHGYHSVSAAIARLQHAADVPGPDAALVDRMNYQTELLRLAMEGDQRAQMTTSMASLQQMATREHCVPCRFYALLGQAQRALYDTSVDAARPYLAQALAAVPEGDPVAQERLLAARGNLEGEDRNLNLGIAYSMRALDLAEARGDAAEAVRVLGQVVWMDADLGDLKQAATLGHDSYARAAAMDYTPMMARISLDLGNVYSLTGDREHQRVAIERALALSADDPDQLSIHILSLNNLSDFYLSKPGADARVLDYATRAEALARRYHMDVQRAAPLTNMGIALARMGRIDEAVADMREAIGISEKVQMKEYVVGITEELVKVLEQAGRYREALAQLHKADALEADLTRQQRNKAVLELQEKYAAERKSQRIAQLSAQNELKQAQLAAGAWRNRLWIALAAVLALGSVVLMQSIRRTRQANRQLAVANASLAELSTIDPLTGAFNRRHTQMLLERQQQPAPRRRAHEVDARAGTGLLILDLDFFKRVNDNWGHAAGDAVLIAVAQRLRGLLRNDDAISRWGGEEFVLVLPNTPASALPALAGDVLHAIGDTPVVYRGQPLAVSASIGAVSFPATPGQGWEAALGLADLALYQAKAGGRNRAFCLLRVAADVIPERLAGNLTEARDAGDVDLAVVQGPARALAPQHGEELVSALA